MLKLISGSFGDLESSLAGRLTELKAGPFERVALIAPSSKMVGHLQTVLAAKFGVVLNLHFQTFSSLAVAMVNAAEPLKKPVLSDSLFFDTLVRSLVRDQRPFRRMSELAVPDGFPPAVRATLRDLLDAGIDVDNVRAALDEDFVGKKVDLGTLRELLTLFKFYLERLESLPVSPQAELLKDAVRRAPESDYLKGFKEILLYGFYDLTGLQADLFQSIVRHHPSTFFFPYIRDTAAFSFAQRFRDTFLQPVMAEEEVVTVEPAPLPDDVRIFNVSGQNDEAWIVAREILRLHIDEKIPFSHMAVIARHQERIKARFPAVFDQWKIPYRSAAKHTLASYPQIARFQAALDAVAQIADWPHSDSYLHHVDRLTAYLQTALAAEMADAPDVWLSVQNRLLEIRDRFDLIKPAVSREEFLDTVRDAILRLPAPGGSDGPGVSLLYAEAARGLSFEAVFMVGVEDRVFPRIIREDPFLRDDARFAISTTLGHKIGQKLTALEEERLLFHLLTRAPSKSLVLVYQRSDDEGKIVGPSAYLRELAHERGAELEKIVVSVPRSFGEKLASLDPRFGGKREVVAGFLRGGNIDQAGAYIRALYDESEAKWFLNGVTVQETLESFTDPGAWDGLVGKTDTRFIFRSGAISPKAMDTYGQCPFQFFARHVLHLRPPAEMPAPDALPADQRGLLIHTFLREFFQRVTETGRRAPPVLVPEALFDGLFEEIFPVVPPAGVGVLPTLWEASRGLMKERLHDYLAAELEHGFEGGLIPTYFEQEITADLGGPLAPYHWTGKIDRIDLSPTAARVVDYKSGKIPSMIPSMISGRRAQPALYLLLAEKFLQQKGTPREDLSFAYHQIGREDKIDELSAADWRRTRPEVLATIQEQVALMHEGNFLMVPDMRSPSDKYCRYCDVDQICRRHHRLSAARATRGEGLKLAAIRNKKIKSTRKPA